MDAIGFADVDDVWTCLLRDRTDAGVDAALRHRAFRRGASGLAAAVRCDDRLRNTLQQDGAGPAPGLRPDARASLRDLDGLLCEWRRLLSLFLFGRARLRSYRAGGHLRPRLSADRGSLALRRSAVAEENPAQRQDRAIVDRRCSSMAPDSDRRPADRIDAAQQVAPLCQPIPTLSVAPFWDSPRKSRQVLRACNGLWRA